MKPYVIKTEWSRMFGRRTFKWTYGRWWSHMSRIGQGRRVVSARWPMQHWDRIPSDESYPYPSDTEDLWRISYPRRRKRPEGHPQYRLVAAGINSAKHLPLARRAKASYVPHFSPYHRVATAERES